MATNRKTWRLVTASLPLLLALGTPSARADGIDDLLGTLPGEGALHAAVAPPLQRARDGGLPVRLLIAKAREGLAKKVPPPVLGAVLERFGHHLEAARALVPSSARARPETIEASAQALYAGVALEDVRTTVAWANGRKTTDAPRAIAALSDLHQVGVPPGQAMKVIEALDGPTPVSIDRAIRTLRWVKDQTGEGWGQVVKEVLDALPGAGNIEGAGRSATERLGVKGGGVLNHPGKPIEAKDGLSGKAAERGGKPAEPPGQSNPHGKNK